ncbi:MAG TPA: hypothetical protein VEH56_08070 [Candidatus Saccharimonadales bacterium]|nr:hypothetical protein [Candidatus Saccharimonadales bacterium]
MRRTIAAYAILVGLTALMVGFYLNEYNTLSSIIRSYVIPYL